MGRCAAGAVLAIGGFLHTLAMPTCIADPFLIGLGYVHFVLAAVGVYLILTGHRGRELSRPDAPSAAGRGVLPLTGRWRAPGLVVLLAGVMAWSHLLTPGAVSELEYRTLAALPVGCLLAMAHVLERYT
ncbi:MAG: hypothetical protein ACK47B_17640 [Armatimonadota bacterium]